jgi:hypothetical protein
MIFMHEQRALHAEALSNPNSHQQRAVCLKGQVRRCTYNLALWRVCLIIVAVEAQQCILVYFPHFHKLYDFWAKIC